MSFFLSRPFRDVLQSWIIIIWTFYNFSRISHHKQSLTKLLYISFHRYLSFIVTARASRLKISAFGKFAKKHYLLYFANVHELMSKILVPLYTRLLYNDSNLRTLTNSLPRPNFISSKHRFYFLTSNFSLFTAMFVIFK